ncbi:GMP synthase [Candidatus Dojkabacteria bacterium]|nr:GMP synthase [Candidatus Dojkabacteria bacterium]
MNIKNRKIDIIESNTQLSIFSKYLKEIVYGGNDGIISTFVVIAGFSGANFKDTTAMYSFLTVLLFGLANLFADATSMALGNFLSIRAHKGVYKHAKKKEQYAIENEPETEKEETMNILKKEGFTEKQAEKMTSIIMKNKSYWLEWMMNREIEIPNLEEESPVISSVATFLSFVVFGFIPLMPVVIFKENMKTALYISSLFTFISLILLGILRWKTTKESLKRSIFEMLATGSVSALVAFLVGRMFSI